MEYPVQKLARSKYFTNDFNAAIYDGPLRIYFAQAHESEALKVYYHLQQKMFKESPRESLGESRNVFVMLYPNGELMSQSFASESGTKQPQIACEKMGEDVVLGVCGMTQDADYDTVCDRLALAIHI